MFERDAIKLSENALIEKEYLINIGALVLLSIRQPFEQMPRQMLDVMQQGDKSKYLFGWKRKGFQTIKNRAKEFQQLAINAKKENKEEVTNAFILALMEIEGLGIVKASFFAQMLINDGACLDSHNLTRLGIDANQFKTPKTLKLETVRKKLRTYNAVWKAEGNSAYWWNSWCDYVAARPRNKFANGDEVSAMHLLPIMTQRDIKEKYLVG